MDMREEVIGEWRKMHSMQFRNLFCSTKHCWCVKLQEDATGGGGGRITRMEDMTELYKITARNRKGKRPGDLDVHGTTILKSISSKQEQVFGPRSSCWGQRPVAISCNNGSCPLGSKTDQEFVRWLREYQLHHKDSAPWSLSTVTIINPNAILHTVAVAEAAKFIISMRYEFINCINSILIVLNKHHVTIVQSDMIRDMKVKWRTLMYVALYMAVTCTFYF
jgi:hypothetical protein